MPVQYQVRAQVVDLRNDTPRPTDKFYVDSNVWFWTTYSNVQFSPDPPRRYQTKEYPQYLKQALHQKAELAWCGLSLSELAHVIEKTEFEIYSELTSSPLSNSKEYRHNLPAERHRVVREIHGAWQSVEGMGRPLSTPVLIDALATQSALTELANAEVDGYDLFVLLTLRAAGISQVISDDGDFSTATGITLFTANRNVIAAAQIQGKLAIR